MPPSTAGGWPTEPMVLTTPSTAATMPKAGSAPARRCSAATAECGLVVVGLDLVVHQAFDLVRVQVARDHHAQVVGDELRDMVVVAHHRVLLEQRRAVRLFHVLLDRHQAFLARLLQDVVHQRHQLHVARLGVLAALEALAQAARRGLQHLGLVVGDEGAERRAADGCHLEGQRMQHHGDVAAVRDEHAEHGRQRDDPANDDEHVGGRLRGELRGCGPADADERIGRTGHLSPFYRPAPRRHLRQRVRAARTAAAGTATAAGRRGSAARACGRQPAASNSRLTSQAPWRHLGARLGQRARHALGALEQVHQVVAGPGLSAHRSARRTAAKRAAQRGRPAPAASSTPRLRAARCG